MEERISEGMIKGAKPPILLKDSELKYMKNYICKISGKSIGTGFFCKIPYKDELVQVLITNYHVIDDKELKNKKYIIIYIDEYRKILNLNDESKIFSSPINEYDIMIIKVLAEYDISHFLEIEQNIFNDNSENTYMDESIYILHFPKGEQAMISYGNGFEKINEFDIKHKCNTDFGSSGGPILNAINNKVIGIHKGCIKRFGNNQYNIGSFLKFPLNQLNKEYNNKLIITNKKINQEKLEKMKEYDYWNGKLVFEGEYLNGKRNGKGKEYNYRGKLIYDGYYLDGKRNGKCKEYDYWNEILIFEGEYVNGEKNGVVKEYDNNGNLIFEGNI